MSYQKDRESFILLMEREGMPYELTAGILRDAATIQRIAMLVCSVEMSEREAKRLESRDEHAQARILQRTRALGWPDPDFQGDPRGACVKIKVPSGRTDDWGQVGICVPTRYY